MSGSASRGKGIWEMLGEFFLDASVLIIVFGFMDKYFRATDNEIGIRYGLKVGGIGFACFFIAVLCELIRTEKGISN